MTTKVDVVIIGAGAAGLSAAWQLKKSGLNIRVLEAQDRVGGRVHSLRNPELLCPIELGAEFVHGLSEEIWSIIRKSQATAYEVSEGHLVLNHGRLRDVPEFWDEISDILEKVDDFQKGKPDSSLLARLNEMSDISADKKKTLLGFVEGFHAADPALISTQALIHEETEADENDGTSSFRILNGYDHILKWIAEELGSSLLFSSAVKQVEWSPENVLVRSLTDSFECRAVLVTLPINILKTNDSMFYPPLEMKNHALNHLEMGAVIKTVFQFKTDFFRQGKFKDLAFVHTDDQDFSTWWSSRPIKLPILTAWSGGKKAQHLSSLEKPEIIERAIASLSRIFGHSVSEIKKELRSCHVHNWQKDTHSLGAYSYVKEGGFEAQKELARPVENTLFFAGEATQFDQGQIGTVDGALASGRRASEEILAAFKNKR